MVCFVTQEHLGESDESAREPIDVLEVFEASYALSELFVHTEGHQLCIMALGKASRLTALLIASASSLGTC